MITSYQENIKIEVSTPSKVYKCSNSPTYSITSIGASKCHSDHDETDSDVTFDSFEPLTEEDQEKLTKLGKLRTVEYGLKKGNECIPIFVMKVGAPLLANLFVN